MFSIAGSHKQPSMVSDLRMPAESDNESMADYADGVGDGESYLVLLCVQYPPLCNIMSLLVYLSFPVHGPCQALSYAHPEYKILRCF